MESFSKNAFFLCEWYVTETGSFTLPAFSGLLTLLDIDNKYNLMELQILIELYEKKLYTELKIKLIPTANKLSFQ